MSENERRRGYRYNRVLIETARVLDPQYADAVVLLSGAQIEMLRNVTQYLRRLETYVTEYALGYYFTPTVGDYDSILAIVADLEETLMGNPNTIWGYKDIYTEVTEAEYSAVGVKYFQSDPVPEGYVYVVTSVCAYFTSGVVGYIRLRFLGQDYNVRMAYDASPTLEVPLNRIGAFPMEEGDMIGVYFNVTTQPCFCHLDIMGYKMVVP